MDRTVKPCLSRACLTDLVLVSPLPDCSSLTFPCSPVKCRCLLHFLQHWSSESWFPVSLTPLSHCLLWKVQFGLGVPASCSHGILSLTVTKFPHCIVICLPVSYARMWIPRGWGLGLSDTVMLKPVRVAHCRQLVNSTWVMFLYNVYNS